jgi:hypothetical protein
MDKQNFAEHNAKFLVDTKVAIGEEKPLSCFGKYTSG